MGITRMASGKAEGTWRKTSLDRVFEWDQLSEPIFNFLCKIVSSLEGKRILEGGSGTGCISLKLVQRALLAGLFIKS